MTPSVPLPRGAGRTAVHAWLMLLPAFVLLVAFTHYPAVATLIDSFHSTPKGNRPAVWVGLENYQVMLDDPVFWKALRNNAWFALATIPTSIALALLMALWVNERIAGRAFLRMAYFTPTVLPMVAVANIWLFFYTPQYGLLEQVRGAFGLPAQNWLGDQATALGAVTAVAVWKEAGFFMIFYLAALQGLNPSLREAAAIEGASRWTFFWRVQWPLLMPTTLFVMVNAVINAVRMVDHVVVLTRGAVVGLDAATGAERWRHDVGAVLDPKRPIVVGDVVVVEAVVGLTVLERASGRVRWQLELVRDDDRDVCRRRRR